MITLNDFLYSGDTVLKILHKYIDGLKTEAANAVNVNLKQRYRGDITAREAGSIGGEMVKRMIAYAEQNMNGGNMMK